MVFIQLFSSQFFLKTFPVNLQGTFKCKVKYIDYSHSGASKEFIRFQSSKFRFPNSTYSDSIVVSNVEEWKTDICEFIINLDGYIDLTLSTTANLAPSNFVGYVIGLELEPLDDPVSKLNYNKG